MASSPARRLVLLRHAKSDWPDDVPDHERPLARRGRRDAPAAGRWLRKSGYVPDLVLCSTARRARETWQLAEEEHVTLAVGRDYTDVAPVDGVILGSGGQRMGVSVSVTPAV